MFLSSVTVGGLRRGADLIDIVVNAAQLWGIDLSHAIEKQIDANALLLALTVMTRNTDVFASCVARLLNPFRGA